MKIHVPLLLAVQFLTRVPVAALLPDLTPEQARAGLVRAVGWFPLVGGMIGGVTALVLMWGEAIWPRAIAVILALIVEARLTGAFHEDAVADFCDGFGGGNSPERIREIMKDSRIGSYGALGLMLAVGLRTGLLILLPGALLAPALVASAAFGRWIAVVAMGSIPPLDLGSGVAKDVGQRAGWSSVLLGSLAALPFCLPLGLILPLALAAAVGASLIFLLWFRGFLLRQLGGVTGDCLGFAVYAGQLIVLLAAMAAWPN
ncbi:MAG: adenosylcobinamide-GDP ribazoletransferase [Novosphingobium sp.]